MSSQVTDTQITDVLRKDYGHGKGVSASVAHGGGATGKNMIV